MFVCMYDTKVNNSACHLISTNFTSLSNNIFLGSGPAAGDNTDIVSCSMSTPILSRRQDITIRVMASISTCCVMGNIWHGLGWILTSCKIKSHIKPHV